MRHPLLSILGGIGDPENWEEYLKPVPPRSEESLQAERGEFVALGADHVHTTALWSGTFTDDEGDDVSLDSKYDDEDIDAESAQQMREEYTRFVEENWDDLEGMDPDQAAHDFWLTRNHHGAGFWDRGLGERGDRLTKAAESYGEKSLIVGDDGKLYYEG